ncbi:MAG: PhnD/SsuA/transferrin family substrate-binding protein [Solobacterium sp.]|nr:PhnD/SsuA/transferrin family substrate-binding protein [Solobacterium sp.]
MNLRKLILSIAALSLLAGCSGSGEDPEDNSRHIETLRFQFVPSADPDALIAGTSGLGQMVIDRMAEKGYTIDNVEITVSGSYEEAGEALSEGTVDVAWIPGATYAACSDRTEVILTATRSGLSNDSTDPWTWNGYDNRTIKNGPPVAYYRSLILAAPTEYGRSLAETVNRKKTLSWDELSQARWGVLNPVSSAGYLYPTLWLINNYGKKLTDLDPDKVITLDSYQDAFRAAARGEVDIIFSYADGRDDYEEAWNLPADQQDSQGRYGMGRTDGDSIWNELNVIGVSDGIYNDAVAVTRNNPSIYNEEFIGALQQTLIEIIGTEEGAKIFALYSHTGYTVSKDSDYDSARAALKVLK